MTLLYIIIFCILFCAVLATGIPVGFGLGVLSLGLMIVYMGFDTALATGIEKAYTSLDSSVLVAIPLYVLAANLISVSGMGRRLFDLARAFLGNFRGGLSSATVISSAVFAAMTGSSFVSASTMGLICIPELRKAKYDDATIAAAVISGGSLGSIIPPSLVMIIYAFLTDESVGKLFMAGMIPGLLLVAFYCIALTIASPKASVVTGEGQPAGERGPTKWQASKDGFWGIMAPAIILGGIYFGIFTASEAAAVACVYCVIIGFFIYRSLTLKSLWQILMTSTAYSAMIAVVIIGGAMLAHVCVYARVPQLVLEFIIAQNLNPLLLIILVNSFLFFLGMFMESISLMYLAIPLLYPVVLHMGWDNIWFAVLMLINVNLGLLTPPMGGILFIVAQIGGIKFETVVRGALIPLCLMLFLIGLLIAFPSIATWLPSLMD